MSTRSTQLKETNDEALSLITVAAQNMIIMGRSLKSVLEDKDKKDHEMIIDAICNRDPERIHGTPHSRVSGHNNNR